VENKLLWLLLINPHKYNKQLTKKKFYPEAAKVVGGNI